MPVGDFILRVKFFPIAVLLYTNDVIEVIDSILKFGFFVGSPHCFLKGYSSDDSTYS